MSTHSKVDSSTLSWVRNEIDETLKQARLALEAFADNPADKTRLRFCVTHLHQVVGTLLMVELDGAAALAREAEALADVVLNDEIEPDNDVFDALTRSILTLPDYLSRLQFGQPDVPLRHLTLINELRAARRTAPLAELDLFAPDLSVRPPPGERAGERLSDAEYSTLVRQLRPSFQNALLAWLRDVGNLEPLQTIAGVLERLQSTAPLAAIEQLFWVAGGFVEALTDNGLEATPERRKLFARLDQQAKKLIDGADKSLLRTSSEALVRGLLLEVAQAASQGARVTQLKRAFGLDMLLGQSAPAQAGALDMPTPEALQSFASALGKEIETAQDLLSSYFDPEHRDPEAITQLLGLLHKMGGTLDMLNVPLLKALVDELAATATAIREGRVAEEQAGAMPMAQALLLVESSARDFSHSATEWKRKIEEGINRLRTLHAPDARAAPTTDGIEVSDAELTDSEFRQLLNVVAGEVGVNLGRIEEVLESFAADTANLAQLDEVPVLLNQILGAMQILGQERASELVQATQRHVEEIREGRLLADPALMDGLAVCVGTIGAYIEGLRTGRRNLEGLIDTALQEMEAALARPRMVPDPGVLIEHLRIALETWLKDSDDAAAQADVTRRLDVITTWAREAHQGKAERIATEMGNVLALVTADPAQLTKDIIDTLRHSFEALAGMTRRQRETTMSAAPASEPAPATPTAAPASSAVPVDVDPEILEIFIEDARDSLATIVREYAAWRENPENQGALTEMRRGYHTIKGSGRMVGATEIAELAWAVENVLNRLRDGKIPYSDGIVTLLEQSQAVMPEMIARLEGGPAPAADIASLREVAENLALSGTPGEAMVKPSKPAPRATAPSADLPQLDPTLLEIFANEASGHLSVIRQEIERCRESGGQCLVSEALFRATHTLLGNARSLNLALMTEAANEVEKLLQTLRTQETPLIETQLRLLERFEATVTDLLDAMSGKVAPPADMRERFASIARDAHGEVAGSGSAERRGAAVKPPPIEDRAAPAAPTLQPDPPRMSVRPAEQPATPTAPPPRSEPPRAAAPLAADPVPASGLVAAAEAMEPASADVDPELVEIFQEEAADILGTIEATLTHWRKRKDDRGALRELKRGLHTLKGGARMAGVLTMGALSHNTESLLNAVEDGKVPVAGALFDLLDEVHDTLAAMRDRLQNHQPLVAPDELNARIVALTTGRPVVVTASPPEAAAQQPRPVRRESAIPESQPAPVSADEVPAVTTEAETGDRREIEDDGRAWPERLERRGQIRVNTDLLNQLVNYAGEVSIQRSRMEQQIYGFRDSLAELSRNATRFREQLRELEIQSESQILYRLEQQTAEGGRGVEFDPLEFDRYSRLQQLTRSLTESLHDLTTIQMSLGNFAGEAEAVLQHQARINTELQEGLMRTRMVSFATQAARLRHIARSTARELGKRVELTLSGAEVELDRTVLERMIGPFEHMIRNSIDHGIETEAERRQLGKNPVGQIQISTAQEGSEIVIRFSDDGAGLNIVAIRAKAMERGLLASDADLSDEELIQLILISGFSTAEKLTHVSGRGVGMDVVHSEVKQLGGSMSVDTKRGAGTMFIIRLPLTLSITQALMAYVGDQQFAVPIASVANIVEFPIDKLNSLSVGKNPLLNYQDRVYPYMSLGARLGAKSQPRNPRKVPVLLARTGTRDVAIQVDGLGGTREVVIKALGPQLAEIKGLAGATILGDGRVILILDVAGLWYRDDVIHVEPHAEPEPVPEVRERPVVMVVDDSLTVRKITGKHLQKRGMDVMVAKDGLDAVEQLRDRIPDVMLVDIEMPRMDGYELTSRIRSDERLKHVPIIMITSRAGAKHRTRAFDLGADMYMSKPYQEDELFKNIDDLLTKGRAS